jgi:hypothetical protein
MITNNQLKELLDYNPQTGIFTWNLANSNRIKIGDIAGTLNANGYTYITINKKLYLAHRLAWLYIYDELPKNQIDHINGIKDDNRIENLRDVTHRQNNGNKKIHINGGRLVGATYNKIRKKWQARIKFKQIVKHIGYYNTDIEAHNAYMNYVKQLKGENTHE